MRSAVLVYAALVLLFAALQTLAPPRVGLLALAAVFAPYLYLPLLLLLPLAFWYRDLSLRVACAACALVFSARFGQELLSLSPLLHPGNTRPTASTLSAI